VDSTFGKATRWILGFFITDEIFAVAAAEKNLTKRFFAGLTVLPWIGWTLGTLVGALAGGILPEALMNAMCIALYGMFVAIVVPVAKKEMPVLFVVVLAMVFSCLFTWVPGLKNVSSGIAVSLCAIAAAAVGAWIFPVKEEAA
jgi:predicted branched-subunit amino acid permease